MTFTKPKTVLTIHSLYGGDSGSSVQIFCVSWDWNLARSREILFSHYGYKVISATGRQEAMEHCHDKADLLILGSSVPQEEKRRIIECFRKANDAPVLSLLKPGQTKLPEAEYGVEYMEPELLVRTVQSILQ